MTLRNVSNAGLGNVLLPNAAWYHYLAQLLLEISVLLTFMSTGLIYNFLYNPELKLATTDFHLLHQFIFSAVFVLAEIFISGIPIRFYHIIYCWVVVGLYSGLLYWRNRSVLCHKWLLIYQQK